MKTVINQKVSYEANAINPFTGQLVYEEGSNEPITKIHETTTARLIKDCLVTPENPQVGFTSEEIEHIYDINTAIKEEKDGEIKFEEATFKYILKRVKSKAWGVPSIEFVKFKKYIEQVAEAKKEKKPETAETEKS